MDLLLDAMNVMENNMIANDGEMVPPPRTPPLRRSDSSRSLMEFEPVAHQQVPLVETIDDLAQRERDAVGENIGHDSFFKMQFWLQTIDVRPQEVKDNCPIRRRALDYMNDLDQMLGDLEVQTMELEGQVEFARTRRDHWMDVATQLRTDILGKDVELATVKDDLKQVYEFLDEKIKENEELKRQLALLRAPHQIPNPFYDPNVVPRSQ